MATSQAIIYALQVMDMIVESAFSQIPSVLYQNYLREFWCTAVVDHPTPSTEDSEARPRKESNIKFTIMVTPIELMAFINDVINHKTSVSPLPASEMKGKKKPKTMTKPLPTSQGPKASRALPKKGKKAKTK
ncbi:hypothetical protein Tco_1038537 [Tanacetum coccineum]